MGIESLDEGQLGIVDQENEEEIDYLESEESEDETDESENNQESAEPDPKQSKDENRQFANARKENAKLKLEEMQRENEALKAKLSQVEVHTTKNLIESQITDEMIWKKAEEEQVTESTARKLLFYEMKDAHEGQVKAVEKKVYEVQSKPYFKDIETEFKQWLQNDPNLDPIGVYNFLVGANIDKINSKAVTTATKRNIAKFQDDSRRSVLTGNTASKEEVDYTKVLSRDEIAMANAFGNNPKDIAKYVQSQKRKG